MSTTTTNYELIKPSGSERPDVDIINNNMDTLDEELVVGTTNDIETSSVTVSTGWTEANPLTLGEKFQSAMTKISTMIKNLKWIYKFIGSTDISSIGDGTVTSAISSLNSNKLNTNAVTTSLSSTSTTDALAASAGKALNDNLANKTGRNSSLTDAYTYGGTSTNGDEYLGIEFQRGTEPTGRYRLQATTGGGLYLYQRNDTDDGWNSSLNLANAIISISRSGTTFTATRSNGTTFDFTQQDNNTWTANSVTAAGYVAAPTASKPRYFYSTDSNGTPAWRNNVTYVAPTSADGGSSPGLVPVLSGTYYDDRSIMVLKGSGGWGYLPLANNATTTVEHYALDARMGKTLNDKITPIGTGSRNSTLLATSCANSWTNLASITLSAGTYIIMATVNTGNSQTGKSLTIRWSSNTNMRCSCYCVDNNIYSANIVDYVSPTASTKYYVQGWCPSSTTIGSCSIAAMRIK